MSRIQILMAVTILAVLIAGCKGVQVQEPIEEVETPPVQPVQPEPQVTEEPPEIAQAEKTIEDIGTIDDINADELSIP